jgi:ABC-type branched-subunit amino acid transport system substrate-binding protein
VRYTRRSTHRKESPGAWAALIALPLALIALSIATAVADNVGNTAGVPVDRQDYVTSATTTNPLDGSTVDPYHNDPSSIHVAVNGGNEFARSFVHLALDYLPKGASATQATVTLHVTQQSDASNAGFYPIYNQNVSSAIVQACALTSELPANFDSSKPPAYDCQHGSAVGKPNAAADTWTFSLANLVAYWSQHGNTGAALIPVGTGDPSQTWSVAFYKGRSASTVTYTESPGAQGSSAGPNPAGTTTGPVFNGAPGAGQPIAPALVNPSTVSPANPGGPGPTPAPAAIPPAKAPAVAAPASRPSTGTTLWPWVLLACVGLAAAALATAHRRAVAGWAGHAVPRTTAVFRAHPRTYTLASAALIWGLVFSAYSVGKSTPAASPSLAARQAASTPSPTQGVGPGQTAASPGAAPPGAATTGGTTGARGATASTAGASNEIASAGPGTYRTIDGVQVFFPSDGSPPIANLYQGSDDTVGIDPNTIKFCTHASLTYGAALHISASDLNVYWQWLNDHGGIFGRSVQGSYQNDNYDPGAAVQAAQACKDSNAFVMSGGLCLDCVPAVRQWAEQNHEPYYYNIGTTEGTGGLRFSYTAWPTLEQMGTWFGELAVTQFKGKKVGIIYRQSSNWQPAADIFERIVKAHGMQVVGKYGTVINQGNYNQEIVQLRSAGAELVFAWENALAELEMIKQAQGQGWHPAWFINPFNIVTNTLGSNSLDQPIWGVGAGWFPYQPGYYGGPWAPMASDIKQFEAAYSRYDPGADLGGNGGDLLYLTWQGERNVAQLFHDCGPHCTRNRIIGLLLAGYHPSVPPYCDINFGLSATHHFGAHLFSPLKVFKDPNGRIGIEPTALCIPDMPGS